ncbi:MetQ/NlpA family ABC transporter substrate-binding protein [Glutamicibacter sp. AOP33-2CA-4]|uniref:MetQ/NlpA family ABC transporter substrate-binding protein n=1 Tax=Glutamicibacter sp. AOP33-2CA-4 TaxID=3457690 RepID=UPI004033489C
MAITRRKLLTLAAGSAAILGLTSCGLAGGQAAGSDDKTIKMIVTESAPSQEPTKIAQKLLAEDGWTLEATYVTDIVQPNHVVSNGEYDANFFQHGAYLEQFKKDQNVDVEPAFYTYSSPAGVYSNKYESIEELPEGATIALPVDTANNGRALAMFDKAGVLKVTEGKSVLHLSQNDILQNPKKFKFVEVDQQSLSKTLPDVDAGFLFVRLGAEIGLAPEDALLFEEEEEALPYVNLVAAKPGFMDTEKGKALESAYHSEEVREWYANYLDGALGTPWDRDLKADFASWNK